MSYRNRIGDPKGDDRLVSIRDAIYAEIRLLPYSLAVIEDVPAYGTGTASLRTVNGVAREILRRNGIPTVTISPSSLKKWVTGDGKASKDQMFEAIPAEVKAVWGDVDDNAVDAYWLQQAGLKYLGESYVVGTLEDDSVYDVRKVMRAIR